MAVLGVTLMILIYVAAFTVPALWCAWLICGVAKLVTALWTRPRRTPLPVASGELRTTDRAREAASAALARSYAEGRLTTAELELRTGQALAAATAAELAVLFADLPESAAGVARPRLASIEALAGLALVVLAPDPARLIGAALVALAVLSGRRARAVAIPVLVAAVLLG